jgi:hypothetical protein
MTIIHVRNGAHALSASSLCTERDVHRGRQCLEVRQQLQQRKQGPDGKGDIRLGPGGLLTLYQDPGDREGPPGP